MNNKKINSTTLIFLSILYNNKETICQRKDIQ
jgi:hypothetical protein